MIICLLCSESIPAHLSICPNCGWAVPEHAEPVLEISFTTPVNLDVTQEPIHPATLAVCENCGRENLPVARFCSQCGLVLHKQGSEEEISTFADIQKLPPPASISQQQFSQDRNSDKGITGVTEASRRIQTDQKTSKSFRGPRTPRFILTTSFILLVAFSCMTGFGLIVGAWWTRGMIKEEATTTSSSIQLLPSESAALMAPSLTSALSSSTSTSSPLPTVVFLETTLPTLLRSTQRPAPTFILSKTPTFTAQPSKTPTPFEIPAQLQPIPVDYRCPDKDLIELQVGAYGRVRKYTVSLRQKPIVPAIASENVIRSLRVGENIVVFDGPVCAHDGTWWQIMTESSNVGWSREILPNLGRLFIRVER